MDADFPSRLSVLICVYLRLRNTRLSNDEISVGRATMLPIDRIAWPILVFVFSVLFCGWKFEIATSEVEWVRYESVNGYDFES